MFNEHVPKPGGDWLVLMPPPELGDFGFRGLLPMPRGGVRPQLDLLVFDATPKTLDDFASQLTPLPSGWLWSF